MAAGVPLAVGSAGSAAAGGGDVTGAGRVAQAIASVPRQSIAELSETMHELDGTPIIQGNMADGINALFRAWTGEDRDVLNSPITVRITALNALGALMVGLCGAYIVRYRNGYKAGNGHGGHSGYGHVPSPNKLASQLLPFLGAFGNIKSISNSLDLGDQNITEKAGDLPWYSGLGPLGRQIESVEDIRTGRSDLDDVLTALSPGYAAARSAGMEKPDWLK